MAQAKSAAASTDKVTVACNMPNGLILRLFKFEEVPIPAQGGGTQKEKRAVQYGSDVRLHGTAVPFGKIPNYKIVGRDVNGQGGYALTEGVDAQFMEEWMKANNDSDMVKNAVVFINPDSEYASDKARELRAKRSGLQPIAIDENGKLTDLRTRGLKQPGISGIEVAEENKSKPEFA